MTLVKDGALKYEEMPLKINKKRVVKSVEDTSTLIVLWKLAVRHKVGLLAIGNIVLILNWAFPEWTELVKSLF